MKATICIPVCFELPFLKGCINQIMKHKHPQIEHEIIICDQTTDEISNEIHQLYSSNPEIKIIRIPRIDAGYPIDVACRVATGEYFCTLDVDAFPISDLWLYLPIKLIEKYGFSFIGKESGLHHSYREGLGEYFHLNNYYRISRTDVARKISEEVGFIRPMNKVKTDLPYVRNLNFANHQSFSACDNGVAAQCFADQNNFGPKLCLFMNKIIGKTPHMGVYGMIIDDLVFHMVFGQTNQECGINSLGNDYVSLNNEIYEKGLTDEMVDKLVSLASTQNILDLYGEENLRINGRQYYHNGNHRFLSDDDDITEYIKKIKNNEN